MNAKERAAMAAVKYIRDGMSVGLGTGSTSECFIRCLGDAVASGSLRDLRCVATSLQSERLAIELGLRIAPLHACGVLDVAVDGADEIDPRLNLTKGLGGALLREKLVEQNARRFICIADESKLVERLGSKCAIPVEVIPFGHQVHESFFHSLGGTPRLRTSADGAPFVTDNGNYIYHLKFSEGLSSPVEVDRKLRNRAGVVGTGLFLAMAEIAIIGLENDVRVMHHH